MKCLSCDCVLSDSEATRKSDNTGEFIDLCDLCWGQVQVTLELPDYRSSDVVIDINQEEKEEDYVDFGII